jgi:predicted amidohydrolase
MPRLNVATIQMDGGVASKTERLKRAGAQIAAAANEGATLVVLPESFNTGSTYLETQFEASEKANGESLRWMAEQAKKHQVHLAGSLLLVDGDDSYQAAFLFAPDGRQWRSDKRYPFLWERVLHRDGRGGMVAETAIGRIGLLLGWDAAHEDVYERYAAKVDVLLLLHSQPDFAEAKLRFPDGSSLIDLGAFVRWFTHHIADYAGKSLVRQAQWLQVPIVVAGASGEFSSLLPAPWFSVNALLALRPRWRGKAETGYGEVLLEAPFQQNTRIINARGETISSVETQGDTFALASLELPERPPLPVDGMAQPSMEIPSLLYFLADVVFAGLLIPLYRRGLRRQWGERMARPDASTRQWFGVLAAGMLLASALTWLFGGKKR